MDEKYTRMWKLSLSLSLFIFWRELAKIRKTILPKFAPKNGLMSQPDFGEANLAHQHIRCLPASRSMDPNI